MSLPAPRSIYRALGRTSAWERIGAGVMDKAGVTRDHIDFRPQSWSLVYLLRGRGRYVDGGGRTWPLAPGDCFQRIPGLLHSTWIEADSGWLETWIDLGPALYQALALMQVLRPDPPVWTWGLSPRRIARFTALMHDLDAAGEADLPALCIRIQDLAVTALAANRHQDSDPLERLCLMLGDEASARIDLESLCRREGYDYELVRKAFRERFGISPNRYRIRRRIERACVLLHTTERSIAAIAEDLGYTTPYEFSNQFRQWMGVSPSGYRSGSR